MLPSQRSGERSTGVSLQLLGQAHELLRLQTELAKAHVEIDGFRR
jgi:hypothetical protein